MLSPIAPLRGIAPGSMMTRRTGRSIAAGKRQQATTKNPVVACRYWSELTDGYWGQFCVTQIPHQDAQDFLPTAAVQHLECMQNFVGMLEYLGSWRWGAEESIISTAKGFVFEASASHLVINDEGAIQPVGQYEPGAGVFADDKAAFAYLLSIDQAGSAVSWYARRPAPLLCLQARVKLRPI